MSLAIPGARRRPRVITPELIAVIAIVGLASMAMALLQPVLPLYLKSLGVSPLLIGLMGSAGMAGMVLGESSGGWLADRVGIKAPLIIGTFLCVPLVLSFVFVTDPSFIFLIFFIWGIVRAAIFGPGRGYIGTKIPVTQKATIMALYGTAMAGFRGLGTLSSGFIADSKGYDWVFYAGAAVGVMAGLLVIFSLKSERKTARRAFIEQDRVKKQTSPAEVPLYRHRPFVTQSAIALFFFAASGLGAFISLLGVEVARLDAADVGILFTISAVASALLQVPMGRMADRFSKRNMMLAGLLVTGAGQAVVGLSHGFPQMAAGMIIASAGGACFGPAAVALLSDNVPMTRQNTAMGIYGGCEDAGVILGSAMGGVVWSVFGPMWTFLLIGSLCAVVGAVIAFFGLKHRPTAATLQANPT
jgi:PPP family 3-phenylpropionic acid transporter